MGINIKYTITSNDQIKIDDSWVTGAVTPARNSNNWVSHTWLETVTSAKQMFTRSPPHVHVLHETKLAVSLRMLAEVHCDSTCVWIIFSHISHQTSLTLNIYMEHLFHMFIGLNFMDMLLICSLVWFNQMLRTSGNIQNYCPENVPRTLLE